MSMFASFIVASTPELARADLGEPDYDPAFYYYHSDHLGSSEIMTDRDGDPIQHYGYQPYGNERYKHNTSAFSVTNRFTGQQLDEDIGLYYYGARYYDPELGRFIQPDSVVPGSGSQALNRYSYCFNNPLIFTDPTGNTPLTIFFAFNEAIKAEAAAQGRYWNAAADSISGAFDYLGSGLIACAPGGALGALITGDDPGMAAATSGIHFTIPGGLFGEEGVFSEFISKGSLTDQYLREFAATCGVGALCGGISAEIMGGNFGEGAMWGAASAAASVGLSIYLDGLVQNMQEMFGWGIHGERLDYNYSLYGPDPSEHWGYDSIDEAAKEALKLAQAGTNSESNIVRRREYSGYLYKYKGKFGFTGAIRGYQREMPAAAMAKAKKLVPSYRAKIVGVYHSHAYVPWFVGNPERFSGVEYQHSWRVCIWIDRPRGDIPFYIGKGINGYLITPEGKQFKFDYKTREITRWK